MDQSSKTTELTYSLTFIQKLMNPVDGFIYRVLSVSLILAAIFGLITGGYSFVPMWIFAFIIVIIDIIFFRRHLLETLMVILERDHSRCIVVGPEYLGFGHKKPEFWILRKPLKVYKGVAGTHLIRIGHKWGRSLTVSNMVISLSELKKLVEIDEAPSQLQRKKEG